MEIIAVGTHFIGDLSLCNKNYKEWRELVRLGLKAVETAGMTLLGYRGATVTNGVTSGATLVVLLKESHISIHTWPELGYAAVDLFTCGDRGKGARGFEELVGSFAPGRRNISVVERVAVADGK